MWWMSLLGTMPIIGSEDEVSLLGLAMPAMGCGVATLVQQVLLRQGWLLWWEARLIAQSIMFSRLMREEGGMRVPQDNAWWSWGSVGSITTSAEFYSTPAMGDMVYCCSQPITDGSGVVQLLLSISLGGRVLRLWILVGWYKGWKPYIHQVGHWPGGMV